MVPPEASACMLWGGIHRGTIGIDNNVQSLQGYKGYKGVLSLLYRPHIGCLDVSLQKTTSAQFDCKLDRVIGPNVSSFVELEIKLPYFGNAMKYTDFSGIQCILRYVMYNGYVTI